MAYKMFLRDFVPSIPLPMILIDEEKFNDFFPIKAEFSKSGRKTVVRYPDLFGKGSPLADCWFDTSILAEVDNHFLYVLETRLLNLGNDERDLDEYPHKGYIIQGTSYPLSMYPFGDYIGIK